MLCCAASPATLPRCISCFRCSLFRFRSRGYAFYLQIESGRILTRWFGQSERQVLALFELSKIVTAAFGACLVILIDEIDGLCNESPDPSSSRLVYQFQTSFSGCVCHPWLITYCARGSHPLRALLFR